MRLAGHEISFNKDAFIHSIEQWAAPEVFAGIVQEQLQNQTIKQFYENLNRGTLWEQLKPSQRQFLLSKRPWDLSWLDFDFLIGVVASVNKPVAYVIRDSPSLTARFRREIEEIKSVLESRA